MAQAACRAGGDCHEPLPVAENLIMNFLLKLESFPGWNRQYCLDLFILYLRMPGNQQSFDLGKSDSLVN